jgi:hypothetical protein
MVASAKKSKTSDALFRIKRGLCGYVSYLAACGMKQAFSEYVLYEPILRIFTARRFKVLCEYECPGIKQPKTGDRKRLDFYATRKDRNGKNIEIALEVKWVKNVKVNVSRDVEKLLAVLKEKPTSLPLLCIFGRRSHVEKIELQPQKDTSFKERGDAVYADFRKTRYGCRIFQLKFIQHKQANKV